MMRKIVSPSRRSPATKYAYIHSRSAAWLWCGKEFRLIVYVMYAPRDANHMRIVVTDRIMR